MKRILMMVGACCLLLSLSWVALASPHAVSLPWWTVDGGGGTFSTGGGYSLGGTAGQPDAGILTGGGYTLSGGFWLPGAVVVYDHATYLPLVLRGAHK